MSDIHPIAGNHYMASSGHYLATRAAFDVLEAGGNAVDAGVAANLVLAVVHSDQVNVAGVAPMMLRLGATGEVLTISGLGWWPRAATLERVAGASREVPLGVLCTVVPGAPDANIQALAHFGTLSFAEVAAAAIRYARDGFPMHILMAAYILQYRSGYERWPENRRIYLPDGEVPPPGERFVQSDLARTLQFMVDEEAAAAGRGRLAGLEAAREAFYRGDIAAAIVAHQRDEGGLLDGEDLAAYRSAIEPPVRMRLEGYGDPVDVYTCGPWCQGPSLLQMLALLDPRELRDAGHDSVAYVHVVAEAIKLAFADRERYYGDPRFVDVPLERLLSAEYNESRRGLIDRGRAWPGLPPPGDLGESPGVPWRAPESDEPVPMPGDTSFVAVVDADGNAFACNPSDVTWLSPVVPGTGLCPSSRGAQSWAVAGHASSIAPGKRPRLTPNPCLVVREGRLTMPIGTPGGDTQPQAVLQVLLGILLFDLAPQTAIEAPRFTTHSQPDSFSPHTAYPGRLALEGRYGPDVGEALAGLGHDVEWLPDMSWKTAGVCLVAKDERRGVLWGGADPRRASLAMGW